jgi:uncharacterized protein (DUF2141 family)
MVMHDENGNNVFDMAGDTPSEGVGYSNITAPPTGPPDFQICKFRFDDDAVTKAIELYYFE